MINEIIERSYKILQINSSNLSSLSKIYFISIIKLNLDLLNDIENDENNENNENNKITNLIKNIEVLHTEFEKYYIWNGDFYFNDYLCYEELPKSFLTYISENINKYQSIDDIIIKCMIMKDFLEIYETSKFKIINDKINLIELNKLIIIYNKCKKIIYQI